jgi:hypothetical protein
MTTRPTSIEDYLRRYRDRNSGNSQLEGLQECWDDAYAEGRAEVAVRCKDAYAAGYAYGMAKKIEQSNAEQSAEHPDTRRLINELYHDRARLRKVVADAVALAKLAENTIDMLRKTATVKTADGISSSLVLGSLSQFQDTHGDD